MLSFRVVCCFCLSLIDKYTDLLRVARFGLGRRVVTGRDVTLRFLLFRLFAMVFPLQMRPTVVTAMRAG